ncbi:MAG TPA: hypothetical protein VLV55_09535 [Rhizomicrobium sp.]|nr:hypothetical protein [Rhizomicrobium sp.]
MALAVKTPPVLDVPSTNSAAQKISDLDRLAALHAKAFETAQLASLLGRTPYFVGALAIAALATALAASHQEAYRVAWLALVGFLLGIDAYLVRGAMRAPFQLESLRSFAAQQNWVLLALGAAWGCGAAIMPVGSSELPAIAFGIGAAVLAAGILRLREPSFHFVAATGCCSAIVVWMRSPGDLALPGLILLGCAAILTVQRIVEARQTVQPAPFGVPSPLRS